jgi:hypothetical protein
VHPMLLPKLFDERLNVVGWNECAKRVFGDYASRSGRERNASSGREEERRKGSRMRSDLCHAVGC